MEFPLQDQLSHEAAITIILASLLFLIYYLLKWKNSDNINRKPPQPSGSWPLIGHLHLLGKLPHISLGKLADRYGPIFMIKLGVHRTVVVSTADMAMECLGIQDKVFVNRPHLIFVDHVAYNNAMLGFTPYGPYWRQMRKIITLELLSNHQVEVFKHVRMSEVRSEMKAVHDDYALAGSNNAVLVDMKIWFSEINLNTMVRIVAGKSLREFYQGDEYDHCRKVFRDFFELAGAFPPADALPFLRRFDIGGYERAMKKTAQEIDQVAHGWLREHKHRRGVGVDKQKQDFMDVMLDIFEAEQDRPSQFEADTIIKATCMAMILGGADTPAVTLIWALSLLLNNKESLKKAQDELDSHVGKERLVSESDLKNLVYLQAVLKETMRLYPGFPLSVPREAITDCTVKGYHIPTSTRLFVNLYKIHRDPQVWTDPLEFRPERFLTTHRDYDVRGQNFEFMPFGAGRRICPGISFSLQVMLYTLACVLHAFEISMPSDEMVDMTEGYGISNLKETPLNVLAMPRLPAKLYQ